jgi:hypothetical protein
MRALYGIQPTEIIVRYQINHSPHENQIGDLSNIAGKIGFGHDRVNVKSKYRRI